MVFYRHSGNGTDPYIIFVEEITFCQLVNVCQSIVLGVRQSIFFELFLHSKVLIKTVGA